MPPDFKAPVGSEYKFNSADPALDGLRDLAHKEGWSQEAYSRALGLYASVKLSEDTIFANGLKAEQEKLGTNAGARVDAVLQVYAGLDTTPDKRLAKAAAAGLITAAQVEFAELLINQIRTQGVASFSQSHRAAPETNSIPGFDKMNFAQQRLAQDQLRARKTA